MTLTTRMRIIEPHPVKPIWDELRRLVGGEHASFTERRRGDYMWEPTKKSPSPPRFENNRYANEPAQGLPAWIDMEWGADGLLDDGPGYCFREDCPDSDCLDPSHREPDDTPKASIELSFDTTYGYKHCGASCSDLHAYLIFEMGKWLTERNLTWWWYDEFKGEWHLGNEKLGEFGNPLKGNPLLVEPQIGRTDRGFELMVQNGR
jgi:hypothetical protein